MSTDEVSVDLTAERRRFAEEIQAVCKLETSRLVDALASLPRERFLRSGPWLICGETDFWGAPRQTPDTDPRHVYQNVSIAIDPTRQLFNGAPGAVARCIDALGLRSGEHLLHVGCGLGYYSALMAHCVSPGGQVVAVEVDDGLAAEARTNLTPWGSVEVRHGNGTELSRESYDAILVSAGMTHPHEAWLDGLNAGGRLILPLTFTMDQMGTIGKGVVTLLSKVSGIDTFDARVVTMTAIYSAVGIRNETLNDRLREALTRGGWPKFNRLRRDPHQPSAACWLHDDSFCFTTTYAGDGQAA